MDHSVSVESEMDAGVECEEEMLSMGACAWRFVLFLTCSKGPSKMTIYLNADKNNAFIKSIFLHFFDF